MNAALVDTDVVSMLFKGDSRAASFRNHLAGRLLGISFMTLAELERWSFERRWGPDRKADFTRYIAKYTVIPVSRELCMEWALVTFSARRIGRPIQTAEAWTPLRRPTIRYLIANNAADYEMIDRLSVLSA